MLLLISISYRDSHKWEHLIINIKCDACIESVHRRRKDIQMDTNNKSLKEMAETLIVLLELKLAKAFYESVLAKANEITDKRLMQGDDPPDIF